MCARRRALPLSCRETTVAPSEGKTTPLLPPGKPVGARVNLEPDVLGKYVESALGAALARLDDVEARLARLEGA